ncbi:uroporphyrinogen-III synthase [Cryobacterium zhongshanensis]|uniref:Uroporphyrinogen-III synthase n=1 Tax=Cryobacterium zhongshanensis TaxID=2928153 RepID=A0AA41QZP0_9MICO|nr:uroporphyrinogen-III synthase [Cryobacterium zhongshanensis]MCI4659823.1 uroporphyrinogen-III synthase [Cryobacterium zhongshanensis]
MSPQPTDTTRRAGDTVNDTSAEASQPGFRADQLEGFRIAVTSDRRSEDLIAAFERRGAEVVHAPAIRIAAAADDARITSDTEAIIAGRPDVLLATTSYGIRRWFEAADAAGIGHELTETLEHSSILVRGPKARGAVRAAGLDDDGMSDEETTKSLVDYVLRDGAAGKTIAVQLHGFTDQPQLERLVAAGATVLTVAPYRWLLPEDSARVLRLVDLICAGGVDAVTFTSAPAVMALFGVADSIGRLDELQDAFSETVVAAAVGPVTAGPLIAAGLAPIVPERFRMGALIKLVCDHLEQQRVLRLDTRFGPVELRGRLFSVAGARTTLPPSSLTLLRVLLAAGGTVTSRASLTATLPEMQDDHAVDVAISRLRQALPEPGLVATVIKRGYRIDV